MKIALVILAVAIALLVAVEVGLRLVWGFGNPLIYIADEKIGYLLAPTQKVRRFGKTVEINQYSMRSPTTTVERPSETFRVLLLGDSVANGGWWTDQKDTISVRLGQQLQEVTSHLPSAVSQTEVKDGKESAPSHPVATAKIEVLNASANSWGPRNELAYLHGLVVLMLRRSCYC